jgi:hypothetical protein
MAYTTINKSTDYFNTKLWTGDDTSPRSLTGIGFQPDWTIIKKRNTAASHVVFDAVRTAGSTKGLATNSTALEGLTATEGTTANYGYVSSFDSDGFTVTAGATQDAYVNNTSDNYVSWNWKANGAGVSNTDGSITSTVSVNTTSGVSISTYSGTGSAATIGHGLGAVPQVMIVKNTYQAEHWIVYHHKLDASAPEDKYIRLNDAGAVADFPMWNDTAPTSSVFSVGTSTSVNQAGGTFVAYCFAEKQGYSKFGSYTGNGNADGAFVYTGFKPAFLLIRSVSTTNWNMFDNKRSAFNVADETLWANSTNSEATVGTSYGIDILSNGFKARSVSSQVNFNNTQMVYMAFAEAPLVGSNNVPCTAR